MNFSEELVASARAVLLELFPGQDKLRTDDYSLIQRKLGNSFPEIGSFPFQDFKELISVARSSKVTNGMIQGDTSVDNDESTTFNGKDVRKGSDDSWNYGSSVMQGRNLNAQTRSSDDVFDAGSKSYKEENDEQLDNSEYDGECEADREYGDTSERSGYESGKSSNASSKSKSPWNKLLEVVNKVLDVYYPYKTLSAATDFDRFRILVAEKLPEETQGLPDEKFKMLLFMAGGTLIGVLKPREERLANLQKLGLSLQGLSTDEPKLNVRQATKAVKRLETEFDDVTSSKDAVTTRTWDRDPESMNNPLRSRETQFGSRSVSNEYEADRDDEQSRTDRARGLRDGDSSYGARNYDRTNSYGSRDVYSERSSNDARGYDRQTGYNARDPYGDRMNGDQRSFDRQNNYRNAYGERAYYSGRQNYQNSNGYDRRGYGASNYDRNAFRQDYDRQGYERQGYDRQGYDRQYYDRQNGVDNRAYNGTQDQDGSRSSFGRGVFDRGAGNAGTMNVRTSSERNDRYSASNFGRQSYSSLQEYRNNQFRSFDGTAAPSYPQGSVLPEVVSATREILTNFFPEKQIRLVADVARLRQFLKLRFPEGTFSDDNLRMLVSYAGGSYNVSAAIRSGVGERSDPSMLALERRLTEVTLSIVTSRFANKKITVPDGLNKFCDYMKEETGTALHKDVVRRLLDSVGAKLVDQETGEECTVSEAVDEAYVCIAKLVLKEKFPKETFLADLSDFGRFRFQFERTAGPGALLSDSKLREVFIAAGGVFQEVGEPDEVVESNLTRSEMIKKIVGEEFSNGLDSNSADDLQRFRECVKRYNANFDSESDAALGKIISRNCMTYQGRLFSVSSKVKDRIKSLVSSLFNVGARVVYYDAYFEKNDWLSHVNVTSVGLLKALLANYFPNYLFYPQYFEQVECDDSERVKIQREIERVWGASRTITVQELFTRLYVPINRLEKVLQLDTDSYEVDENGEYMRVVSSGDPSGIKLDSDKLDELFELEFDEEEQVDEEGRLTYDEVNGEIDEELERLEDETQVEDDSVEDEDVTSGAESIASQDAASGSQTSTSTPTLFDSIEENAEIFETSTVKREIDAWLEGGGNIVFYEAFWERWQKQLADEGIASEAELVARLRQLYPNLIFNETYFEATSSEDPENEKLKKELFHAWNGSAARRLSDLVRIVYIPSSDLYDLLLDDPEFMVRSNGYWVHVPKKDPADGKRAKKRILTKTAARKGNGSSKKGGSKSGSKK